MSCAPFSTTKLEIQYNDRQTLAFTGKGAAAGIMLDSILGRAGIAIDHWVALGGCATPK
jgi:hypothetical protein